MLKQITDDLDTSIAVEHKTIAHFIFLTRTLIQTSDILYADGFRKHMRWSEVWTILTVFWRRYKKEKLYLLHMLLN